MDDALLQKLGDAAGVISRREKKSKVAVSYLDDDTGEVLIVRDEQREPYALKPLAALYGPGQGNVPVDPQNEQFMPLFLRIEEDIVRFDANRQRLTDADVALALQRLSMNPERPATEPLDRRIQLGLRLTLSLNNYSRQEVRQALRKVAKSVDRHNAGGRGYLDFVAEFFG